MEECPICLEVMNAAYALKGCNHKVCLTCSRKMRDQPENVHYAFQAHYVLEAAPQIQIKCPLCRKAEPVKTAEELKELFPDAYLEWMESELHRDIHDNSFSFVYEDLPNNPRRVIPKKAKLSNNRKVVKPWRGRKM